MEKNIGNKMKEFWKVDEEWRDIRGYKYLYQVSNYFGNVRSRRGEKWKIMKLSKIDGFLFVSLSNGRSMSKSFPVHRLVVEAFVPNEEYSKRYVTHIDGDKSNNCVLNLAWETKGLCVKRSTEFKEHKEKYIGYKIKGSQ